MKCTGEQCFLCKTRQVCNSRNVGTLFRISGFAAIYQRLHQPLFNPFSNVLFIGILCSGTLKKKTSLAVSVRRSGIRSWRSAMENNDGKWTDFLPSPNYSEDLSRTPCQRWPRTDPIWPLAHTRQLLVLVPVKRRSMRPALIVIISDRLPGTISNPHHLSCRQVSPPWWRSLASSAVKPCCGSERSIYTVYTLTL